MISQLNQWSLGGALQFEDALLFVWLAFVTPLLQSVLGGALRGLNLTDLDLHSILQIVQSDVGRFELGLLIGAMLVFYLMFVFAPGQMAGRGGRWPEWGARFALYLLGMILNIGLLQNV